MVDKLPRCRVQVKVYNEDGSRHSVQEVFLDPGTSADWLKENATQFMSTCKDEKGKIRVLGFKTRLVSTEIQPS